MPIRIDRLAPDTQDNETVAWLCDDCWRLSDQGKALEAWLTKHGDSLPTGEYRADIGFSPREDAMGGGVALPVAVLKRMADLNMELYLSEYQNCTDTPSAD